MCSAGAAYTGSWWPPAAVGGKRGVTLATVQATPVQPAGNVLLRLLDVLVGGLAAVQQAQAQALSRVGPRELAVAADVVVHALEERLDGVRALAVRRRERHDGALQPRQRPCGCLSFDVPNGFE